MNNIINGLSIVATPIGNLDDITYRAVKILGECDIVICENPKHSLKLLNKLGIKKKLIALHDYNEHKIIDQIILNKNEYIIKKNNLKKLNEKKNWENINQKLIRYFNDN